MGSFLWGLVEFLLKLLGVDRKSTDVERQEQAAHSLGQQEVRTQVAEQVAQARQAALDLEVRIQEAQARVAGQRPPTEQPHEGTDLFRQ
jgi:hypothetical protein